MPREGIRQASREPERVPTTWMVLAAEIVRLDEERKLGAITVRKIDMVFRPTARALADLILAEPGHKGEAE